MLKVFERINVEVETRKAQTCFFRGGGGGGGKKQRKYGLLSNKKYDTDDHLP